LIGWQRHPGRLGHWYSPPPLNKMWRGQAGTVVLPYTVPWPRYTLNWGGESTVDAQLPCHDVFFSPPYMYTLHVLGHQSYTRHKCKSRCRGANEQSKGYQQSVQRLLTKLTYRTLQVPDGIAIRLSDKTFATENSSVESMRSEADQLPSSHCSSAPYGVRYLYVNSRSRHMMCKTSRYFGSAVAVDRNNPREEKIARRQNFTSRFTNTNTELRRCLRLCSCTRV
jgi:hypothetical protein